MKIITAFWPARIWQQFAVVLVLLAAVPLLVLGAALIRTSQEAIRVSVLRDHGQLALRAAGQVNEFVQKPRELLGSLAALLGVCHTNEWRQETAIVELALRYAMFRRIASVRLDGREAAVSKLGSARRDWSHEEAFLRARGGEYYMSPVQTMSADTPVVTLAVPITQMGQVSGVLVAEVDLRGMWAIVDSIRVGKTGYACVMDKSRAFIAHPDKKMVLEHGSYFDRTVTEQLFKGKAGSRENRDSDGRRWLVSYAPLVDTGWGLLIVQSADEAYAFSRIMLAQAWFLILLSIAVAFITSMALANFMSRPLNMLLEGTRRIARKDFEHPLPTGRNDEIGQIMGSFNDMTLQLKQAQQEEKLSIIGRAATAIVHELKNSLVLVDTYMQMLGERHREKEFMQEFVQIVPRELGAWKGMLKNMIEYARVPHFSLERLDLNALIKDVAILAKARIGQYDINLVVETSAGRPVIRGNADKLRQVVLNLVANAIDHTPPQGTIRLATVGRRGHQGPADRAMIYVENTGPGIPPDQLDKIFEPFFTTKDGGLGLGLAICREIVERHGGVSRSAAQKAKLRRFR